MKFRIGQGVDTHQLLPSIPLIIGGVSIPYSKGSKGHSDGDVLYHAIVDAMFGALALGDIGDHFPSNNKRWKNAPSRKFLKYAQSLIKEKRYTTINIDATVILQEPCISSYISEMRENVSHILSISVDNVSVKATPTDFLGHIGSEEGIAAIAVALLKKTDGH